MRQSNAQKAAIDPNISARVSANAGTGKTYILVNRFLRLLLAGSHPNRILCLTYTKAAAAEMSERITKKLKTWVMASDKDLHLDLQDLLDRPASDEELLRARQLFTIKLQSMPPPRIQTIHSFCQEILSQFTLEAGLSYSFKVVDDLTAAEFLNSAKKALLSKSQNEPAFAKAVSYVAENASEFKFDAILDEVISNRNKFRKLIGEFPDEAEIIDNLYNKLGLKRGLSAENIETEIANFDYELIKKYLEVIENGDGKKELAIAANIREQFISFDTERYIKIFLRDDYQPRAFSQLMTKKSLAKAPELEQELPPEQERVHKLVDDLHSLKIAEFTEQILVLVYGFVRIYEDIKLKNNALDYEDLIYYTVKLLENSDSAAWVLYKLDGGIEHILVDEAQDTSLEQWQIISHIADDFFTGEGGAKNERTIFIVGDEKQSIYSFQGAEPKSFSEMSAQFAYKAISSNQNWMEIPLNKSFRSVDAVLGLVDSIFSEENLKNSVSFSEDKIEHEVNRIGQGGVAELWPLEEQKDKEKIGAWEPPITVYEGSDVESDLAKKIAKTISKWLQDGREIEATGKQIKPSDVMILLRKRGAFANKLIREMKKQNVPVAGSDRLSITKNIAVMDLIALGNFLLLPEDDYSLACALKSPIFGVSEDELFELCYGRGEQTILQFAQGKPIAEELNKLLDISAKLSPFELYSHILDVENGRKKFISRLGDEVNDPLNEFLDLCLEFESSHNQNLQEFLHWLSNEEILIKRDMEQNINKVRVLTVHASKGLQAPIVFLPDTTSVPSGDMKSGNNIIWDEGLFYSATSSKNFNQHLKGLTERRKSKEEEEYNRLLYVALTRAADEIYIAGIQRHQRLADNCWYSILQRNMEKIGNKDGDLIRFKTEQTQIIEEGAKKYSEEEIENIPAFYYEALT